MLVCFSKVIALYPAYSSGYSFRAETYLADGDYVKAIDDICEALKIDSDSKAYYGSSRTSGAFVKTDIIEC